MGEESEELKFELLERLEDAYRLPISMQVFLFIIIEVIVFSAVYYVRVEMPGTLTIGEGLMIFLLATALVYPMAIKVRNFFTELIASFIYGSFIASFVYYLYSQLVVVEGGADNPNLWMLVIFVLVVGVEMLHHMHEKVRTLRTKPIILVDVVLSVIFGIAMFMFLYTAEVMRTVGCIVASFLVGLLYAYAILPEKPY